MDAREAPRVRTSWLEGVKRHTLFTPGRNSSRLLLGGAFDLDLYLFAECTRCFDQRIQLNRNVAWIQHTVELRAAGRHLLGHVQLGQVRRLHAFLQLFGESALKCLRLNFPE